MLELITNDALFGILLTIIAYEIGVITKKRIGEIVNPLLLAIILIIGTIVIFKIPYTYYAIGGNFITLMINPATVLLAVPLYKNMTLVKKYFIPIIAGAIVGVFTSILSVTLLSNVFQISPEIKSSLIPKTVTTAIAIPLSEKFSGIVSLTVIAVILTGIVGSILAPYIIRVLKIKNSVSKGVAIGTASHAIGTSKAIEMGEEIGAISSISMVIAGIIITILAEFMI